MMNLQKVRKQLMEFDKVLGPAAEDILSLDPDHLVHAMSIGERVVYRRVTNVSLTGLQMRLSEASMYLTGLMQILQSDEKTNEEES